MIAMIWACSAASEAWEPTSWRSEEEDDDREEREEREVARGSSRATLSPGVPPVTDPTWKAECGSCHLAYSPGLLPSRSWDLVLGDLAHHYGDDASVDAPTLERLKAYAAANAADVAPYRLSRSLAASGGAPLRILDQGGLRHEHGELPASWVTGNPEVRSLSNCAACHPAAADGRFDEGSIVVPGHGRFDD